MRGAEVASRGGCDGGIGFYWNERGWLHCAAERGPGFSAAGRRRTALVIGRKTFETVLSFPKWPYGKKRVVVLSSQPLDFSAVRGGTVEQMGGPPAEIVSKLAASGAQHVYIDGGITIQRFLRAGLIQRLIITRVPVLIGEGIPLFGTLLRDIRLRHVATKHYQSGLVQTEYEVLA